MKNFGVVSGKPSVEKNPAGLYIYFAFTFLRLILFFFSFFFFVVFEAMAYLACREKYGYEAT